MIEFPEIPITSIDVSMAKTSSDSLVGEVLPSNQAIFKTELDVINCLLPPSDLEIIRRMIFLGPKTKRFTLVMDLDETLVLSKVRLTPAGKEDIEIQIRPFALQLLEEMSKGFELVVFTAAESDYASQVVELLDPKGIYIKKVLSKRSCIEIKPGLWIKDLRIFGDRSLNEILIVDNSVISFAFQLDNGIPVLPYEGQKDDNELELLIEYLSDLQTSDNIVAKNKAAICLS